MQTSRYEYIDEDGDEAYWSPVVARYVHNSRMKESVRIQAHPGYRSLMINGCYGQS